MKRFGGRSGAIIFGPPGAGKGTYGDLLVRDFRLSRLSPGDIFRAALRADRPETAALAETMRLGHMVGDEQVLQAVFAAVEALPAAEPLLFDGVPRTAAQVGAMAAAFDLQRFLLIDLDPRRDFLLEKLGGRRVCDCCGKNYNVCRIERDGYSLQPLLSKAGEACEVCGGALRVRPDDTPAAIAHRLELYDQQTRPLLEQLLRHGLPRLRFDPKRGVHDYPEMRAQIAPFLAAGRPAA